ncbi:MAG: hypothetical protein ACOYI2_00270 [Bacillota bacterium]
MAVTRKFITADGLPADQLTSDEMKEFGQKLVNCLISIAYEQMLNDEKGEEISENSE